MPAGEALHFRFIGHLWQAYGQFVGLHPYPFLIVPLFVCLSLSTGILFIHVEDDLRILYSPSNAPSRREFRIHQQFTGDDSSATYCALAVESAKNSSSNLLTKERADLIQHLNNYVLHNMTVQIGSKVYHFGRDICPKISFCPDSNQIVKKFLDIYWNPKLREDPRVQLNYPMMEIYDARFFLPAQLYGVKTDPKSGAVVQVKMVHLVYPIPSINSSTADQVVHAFEVALHQYFDEQPGLLKNFAISLFSQRILKEEVNKNTTYTLPFISITCILIIAFTVISCITSDMLTSKPLEGLLGVNSSALSIVACGGLMGYLGVPYISQVAVMPFLALAIGLTMKEAGSSITVTSLTDCIAFAIGAISTTPAISIFCKYICAAICFDFFFQVTFFAAVIAIGGQREASGKHSIMIWKKLDTKVVDKALAAEFSCPMSKFFASHYSKFICHRWTRFLVLLSYVLYWGTSIYGCTILKATMSPTTLLVDDSPLRHYIALAESHIWAEGLVGRVYVNKVPDFSNEVNGKKDLQNFFNFVRDLENTRFSIGTNSTQLWLYEYMDYLQYFQAQPKDFYYNLKGFLGIQFNSHWKEYLRWKTNPNRPAEEYVYKFYFTTGFQVKDWRERTHLLQEWRRVCARHSQFDALVYDENNFFSDQILFLPATGMQSLGIAILVMSIVCILFIADVRVCFWVMFTMVSMDVGIIGLLSMWGSDLSPTTIQNILMSIGLCVDFVTHVGYRIYRTHSKNPDETISEAMGSIAWPVLQGGLSTFFAVCALQFVASFVVRIFFRTVFLVVVLGLYHGLVLLPVMLRSFISAKPRRYGRSDGAHLRSKRTNHDVVLYRNSSSSSSNNNDRTINYDTFKRSNISKSTHSRKPETPRTLMVDRSTADFVDPDFDVRLRASRGHIMIHPITTVKPKAWKKVGKDSSAQLCGSIYD